MNPPIGLKRLKRKKKKKRRKKKKGNKKKPVLNRSMTARLAPKPVKPSGFYKPVLKSSKSMLPVEYRTSSNRNYDFDESEGVIEDDDEIEDNSDRDD